MLTFFRILKKIRLVSWRRCLPVCLAVFLAPLLLAACQPASRGTLAELHDIQIELEEERIEGGLERAMEGYKGFLEETPESELTPEAIRRLADLKIERDYGYIQDDIETPVEVPAEAAPEVAPEATPGASPGAPAEAPIERKTPAPPPSEPVESPLAARLEEDAGEDQWTVDRVPTLDSDHDESVMEFEERATEEREVDAADIDDVPEGDGALEAIELYQQLLEDYPEYERNDQVLYQMSRAYQELGRVEEAMEVNNRLVREFPYSRYLDEVQFRRGEYYFTRGNYLDAEEAYSAVVDDIGVGSFFYEIAIYKLGWAFYRQGLYQEGLHRFFDLLDHKVEVGYDFYDDHDEPDRQRIADTFRVVSLSFSNQMGPDSVVEYFSRYGRRDYEDLVYSRLGEHYYETRRFSDAAAAYDAFISRNPFHEAAPQFHMRMIEIYMAGAFPSLVIETKKEFAGSYGLQAEYWQYFEPRERPEVLDDLKTNLTDLANHYHARYQNPRMEDQQPESFEQAVHWYREFIDSFPEDPGAPDLNYQLADLLMEDGALAQAAVEYEKTAYGYPPHERAAQAGYTAVYAYREYLHEAPAEAEALIRPEAVRSSLKFAENFPEHREAANVLGAAVDDLYDMEQHERAVSAGRWLIADFPDADVEVLRRGWLIVAHSTYELRRFSEAEEAYASVLELLPEDDESRDDLTDNLAASIYRQGEQANKEEDYRAAADHFMRVGRRAPNSEIRSAADYDASVALIQLKAWEEAVAVLLGFRDRFPGHRLQPEVTKKIAFVYREDGRLSLAAAEYERIERESDDDDIRREALLLAAELYEEVGKTASVIEVYRRYVDYFPRPVEFNLEIRNEIAKIHEAEDQWEKYLKELRRIVDIDAAAGEDRTNRTRVLAARAALVLAKPTYEEFAEVKLVQPFEPNLRKKQELMRTATRKFDNLREYGVGGVTAAAMYYLGEIYAHFSEALLESERPEGLSPLEMEQYVLAIEDRAFPFEDRAIEMHESNISLIARGIYNEWIDKSLERLAGFFPARYDKPEESSGIIASADSFVYQTHGLEPPEPGTQMVTLPVTDVLTAEPATAKSVQEPAEAVEEAGDEPEGEAGQAKDDPASQAPEAAPKEVAAEREEAAGQAPEEDHEAVETVALPSSLADASVEEAEDVAESAEPAKPQVPQVPEMSEMPEGAAETEEAAETEGAAETEEAAEAEEAVEAVEAVEIKETGETTETEQAEEVEEVEEVEEAAAETVAAGEGVKDEAGDELVAPVPEATSSVAGPAEEERKSVEIIGEDIQDKVEETSPEVPMQVEIVE